MNSIPEAFWCIKAPELLQQLQSTSQGLSSNEARQRLVKFGGNRLTPKKRTDPLSLLLNQFRSPIIIILLFAAGLSLFLHDPTDAIIILAIVLISGLLGFWQERGAKNAVEKLLALVRIKAKVLRGGTLAEILVEEMIPGDVVILAAGDTLPGDCLLLESKDLFVNESALTGETYPVEKVVGILPAETGLSQRTNTLFMGTHVASGSAKALVVRTGKDTELGKISERLKLKPPETEFERGVRRFGYFLMEMTIATDSVDTEMIETPRRWNIRFIRRFMFTFGCLSSVFDFLTFGVLLLLLHASPEQLRTGWFIESVISATLIVFVIRSRGTILRSSPGRYLVMATILIVGFTLIFPFSPLANLLGFKPLPVSFILIMILIVAVYVISAEILKHGFYRRIRF
jgi:magnesium-transporting ATPase (P-type)